MRRNQWVALVVTACTGGGALTCGTPIPLDTSPTTGASPSSTPACATRSYKYIFATGATGTSGFGSVSGADSKCDAVKPSCVSSAKALIVDALNRRACSSASCGGGSGEHIGWVLTANQEYRRTDDTTLIGTTNSVGIFNFPLTSSFTTGGEVWTGLNTDWTTGDTCSNWTNASAASPYGKSGDAGSTSNTSISLSYVQSCARTDLLLYCVEQ